MTDILNCDIQDVNLYNDSLNEQYVVEYIIKYLSVIISFVEYAYLEKNRSKDGYLNFVIHQGIYTLHHIFLNLLMYTKNIELVFSNLKKAYYYYIEFIQQIKKDEHQFLKFNVKDAILFVYKKTINELNEQFVRQHDCDSYNQNVLNVVEELSIQWNDFVYFITKVVRSETLKPLNYDHDSGIFRELNNKILVLCQIQLTDNIKLLNVGLIQNKISDKQKKCTDVDLFIKEIINVLNNIQENEDIYINHL